MSFNKRFLFLSFLFSNLVGTVLLANKPNVLFISIDDLNDYISPLDNHSDIITPNFDKLAKRSVNFTNAHCAAPACHPSRVAVMTGVHPSRSGIYRNMFEAHGPRWRHESKMLENAVVLSQIFRDNGYEAVGGGKIFHTLQWTPGDRHRRIPYQPGAGRGRALSTTRRRARLATFSVPSCLRRRRPPPGGRADACRLRVKRCLRGTLHLLCPPGLQLGRRRRKRGL